VTPLDFGAQREVNSATFERGEWVVGDGEQRDVRREFDDAVFSVALLPDFLGEVDPAPLVGFRGRTFGFGL
jgi:hypothetical protein